MLLLQKYSLGLCFPATMVQRWSIYGLLNTYWLRTEFTSKSTSNFNFLFARGWDACQYHRRSLLWWRLHCCQELKYGVSLHKTIVIHELRNGFRNSSGGYIATAPMSTVVFLKTGLERHEIINKKYIAEDYWYTSKFRVRVKVRILYRKQLSSKCLRCSTGRHPYIHVAQWIEQPARRAALAGSWERVQTDRLRGCRLTTNS
jgi:hypothetical protein